MPVNYDNALLASIHYDVLSSKVGRSYGGAELIAYDAGDIKMEEVFRTVRAERAAIGWRWAARTD